MRKRSRKRYRKELPDGLHIDAFDSRIDLSLGPDPNEIPTVVHHLCEIDSHEFEICPLCAGPLAVAENGRRGTAEHVPPFALGGFIRTRTCGTCNVAGSAAEADLVRWWSKAYRMRVATPELPGSRVAGDVLLRWTSDRKFALVVSGRPSAGVHDVLETAGTADDVTATVDTGGEWLHALLKSSYLAACLHLGEIPVTADSEHARATIRSGSFGGATVGTGPGAVPFRVFRTYGVDGSDVPRLWLGVAMLPWHEGDVPILGIGLGQVAFVAWPIPDLRDRAVAIARDPIDAD